MRDFVGILAYLSGCYFVGCCIGSEIEDTRISFGVAGMMFVGVGAFLIGIEKGSAQVGQKDRP